MTLDQHARVRIPGGSQITESKVINPILTPNNIGPSDPRQYIHEQISMAKTAATHPGNRIIHCATASRDFMDLRLEVDSVNKIIRVSLQGEITDEFLLLSYEALKNLCNLYCPRGFIIDFTKVTKVKLSSRGVLNLASKPPIFPDCLTLNVAPQDDVYGMSRMFQSVAENRPNFCVLRTMEEALNLLGVESPKFDAILDTQNRN